MAYRPFNPIAFRATITAMRWLILPISLLAAAAAFLLPAQTNAPNASGVAFGHIHLYVADVAATEKVLVDVRYI
jgi:uncharacterized membrane protein YqhA